MYCVFCVRDDGATGEEVRAAAAGEALPRGLYREECRLFNHPHSLRHVNIASGSLRQYLCCFTDRVSELNTVSHFR
jgi:hypothetical protein